jgi:hypothetical protein
MLEIAPLAGQTDALERDARASRERTVRPLIDESEALAGSAIPRLGGENGGLIDHQKVDS